MFDLIKMNTKKIILTVLGLGVVTGLGLLAVKSQNQNINTGEGNAEIPIEVPENPANNFSEFGQLITLQVNDKITFSDGLYVILKEINDSRCPKDVQCIWAGEIEGVFTKGNTSGFAEIRLGTVNNKSVIVDGYTFSLVSATENTVIITVQSQRTAWGDCYVGGCSSQICSDKKDVISTCEYKEEYACYKTAKCERQDNGQCGWTPSHILISCLGFYRQ